MAHDVSVIGLYILDVLGRPVTRIPDRGNVDFIEEIRLTVAGTAGGTVVDTAKLGLKSLAVGAVGDDEKADWVLMTLEKHGIDTSAMQRIKGVPTSATILNVRPNGDRPALHVRGASDHFDVPPSAYDKVFDAPIIHLGGTGLLKKLDGEFTRFLLLHRFIWVNIFVDAKGLLEQTHAPNNFGLSEVIARFRALPHLIDDLDYLAVTGLYI
jgi:sugar/nucleoside kinase (ribokinase family)